MVNLKNIPQLTNTTGKQLIHYAEMLKKTKTTEKHLINPKTIELFAKTGDWLIKQSRFIAQSLGIKLRENLNEFEMPDEAKAATPQELSQRIQDLKNFGNMIVSAKKSTNDENIIRELTAIEDKLKQVIPLLQRTINESTLIKIKEYWDNNQEDNPIKICEEISKKYSLNLNETLEIVEKFGLKN
jgi:hypothetical protein